MAKTKSYSNRRKQFTLYALLFVKLVFTQNSMVGDGFGGRLWYKPTNYAVGSYCAFSICNNGNCNDSLNQLYGWGHNALNQLGLGQILTGVNTPTTIPNMNNVKYLDCGYNTGIIKNDSTFVLTNATDFQTGKKFEIKKVYKFKKMENFPEIDNYILKNKNKFKKN